MPSTFPAELTTILNTGWCKSYPALDLTLHDGSLLHYSTINIAIGATTYVDRLSKVGSLKMSLLRPADRCEIEINNVDGVPGQALVTPTDALMRCRATLSRIYINQKDLAEKFIITRLMGIFQSDAKAGDAYLKGVVLSDLYAAGNAAGEDEVKVSCTWRYKDPDTCTYAGGLATCDFTLDGPNGCQVHHGTDLAKARFGGNGLFLDDQTIRQFENLPTLVRPGDNVWGDDVDGNRPGRIFLGDGPYGWRII